MAKVWDERRLERGKKGRPNLSKLQPLALQWNTGSDLLSSKSDSEGNDQDITMEVKMKSAENSGNRPKPTLITKHVPQVSITVPGKTDDREETFLDCTTPAPPSLEVTCSTPESQDGASFIEDYWW
jgi:hypothetical protein